MRRSAITPVPNELPLDPLRAFLGKLEILSIIAFVGGMAFDDEGLVAEGRGPHGFGHVDHKVIGIGVGEVRRALAATMIPLRTACSSSGH